MDSYGKCRMRLLRSLWVIALTIVLVSFLGCASISQDDSVRDKDRAHVLINLDEWLGDTRWDVIHFNHGLHDLKYVDEQGRRIDLKKGRQQISIDEYRRNLDAPARRLKKTHAKLIFATTTPCPRGRQGPDSRRL